MTFAVEVVRGTAAEFHARPLPVVPTPSLWWFEVTAPALVLGTAQSSDVADWDACDAEGVDVVRRHSGGAAVLLVPDEVAWFDVIIPRGHAMWRDDVGRAAWWIGEAVVAALGVPLALVHTGPMVRSPWSSLVCFAGIGPGEVTVEGRKLLGISQRRTRDWARFQCLVHRRWDPRFMVSLLAPPRPPVAELDDLVAVGDLRLDTLLAALG